MLLGLLIYKIAKILTPRRRIPDKDGIKISLGKVMKRRSATAAGAALNRRGLRCLRPSLTTCCYRILNGIHQRVTVDLKKQLAERTS